MRLFQRADDGYPVGADDHLRKSYGPIPDAELFQHHSTYRYEKAVVKGWEWSITFNAWRALVTFPDGIECVTSPAPWKRHHDDCPVCSERLSRHSPNGFDVIYECENHHRHIIKGITGEYITLSPVIPKSTSFTTS